ncbi:MAG: flavin reductase family protein [Chitinophagales bacterium]|nr:flavin reductase family protein [Chitinophagales bacterium]
MLTIEPGKIPTKDLHQFILGAVAPRPIAFASTISKDGQPNLAPYSFFNAFSSNPPILIFSPARKVRDNSVKHTLENLYEVPEVVISIVTIDMVQQVSLSSCEFPKGVNEFVKAGFTALPATLVKPPMVKESPVNMECKVIEIKPLGTEGGAGNLVICEVLRMHIDDALLDEQRKIDQRKIKQVARLGGDWYCVVNEQNLFQVEKPNTQIGIGVDALPEYIRNSRWLTGNELGQLGNVHEMPLINPAFEDDHLKKIIQYYSLNPDEMERELHTYAKKLLAEGRVQDAWQILLGA